MCTCKRAQFVFVVPGMLFLALCNGACGSSRGNVFNAGRFSRDPPIYVCASKCACAYSRLAQRAHKLCNVPEVLLAHPFLLRGQRRVDSHTLHIHPRVEIQKPPWPLEPPPKESKVCETSQQTWNWSNWEVFCT